MSWSCSMQGTKAEIAAKLEEEHARGHMPDDHRAAVIATLEVLPTSLTTFTISAYGHRADADNVNPLSNLSIMVSGAR